MRVAFVVALLNVVLAGWLSLLAWGSPSAVTKELPDQEKSAKKTPAGETRRAGPHAPLTVDVQVIGLYRAECLECHDNDGRGAIGRDSFAKIPDFTSADWHASRSDSELSRSVLDGKGKSMPRMREKLGSIDVKQVVAFVRAFQGGKQVVPDDEEPAVTSAESTPPASATPPASRPANVSSIPASAEVSQEGSRLFRRFCAQCHGSDGLGTRARDTMRAIPNFTQATWHDSRSDFELIVSILDGKRTEMPAFRDKVSREQAGDLVTVVRAFAPSRSRTSRLNSSNDFEKRFQALLAELEELRRQHRAIAEPASSKKASGRQEPSQAKQPNGE
jgi:mono/diheme cytochrome c family protein